MEFTGVLISANKNIATGRYDVVFTTNELPNSINCADGVLNIKAVKQRKKRSLDSNAYCWLLISKIADMIGSDKVSVYRDMLFRYGQPFATESGTAELISCPSNIDISRYGLYAKPIEPQYINGVEHTLYMVFRGSSSYDTKEMSIFVDGIVSEAKELGIDTIPIVDLEKMKAKWRI